MPGLFLENRNRHRPNDRRAERLYRSRHWSAGCPLWLCVCQLALMFVGATITTIERHGDGITRVRERHRARRREILRTGAKQD